ANAPCTSTTSCLSAPRGFARRRPGTFTTSCSSSTRRTRSRGPRVSSGSEALNFRGEHVRSARFNVSAAVGVGVLLLGVGRPADQEPTLEAVLERVSGYLLDYEQKLSSLVAEEQYEQDVTRWLRSPQRTGKWPAKRVLTSDYVLLRLPGAQ